MLCGLPGAGKTTLAKKLEKERSAVRFCPDDWIASILASPQDKLERDRLRDPIESIQFQTALRVAELGNVAILENGFWVSLERKAYREKAQAKNIKVELHFLDASFDILWQRVDARNKANPHDPFVISEAELEDGYKLFEPPDKNEFQSFDYHKIYKK